MPRFFQVPGYKQHSGLQQPQLRVKGVNAPPGAQNMRVMVRNRLGDLPGPNGAPGSGVYPYSEDGVWGDGSQGTGPDPTTLAPPAIGAPVAPLDPTQLSVTSTPYGESARDWINPTTYASVPLLAVTGLGGTPIVQALPVLSLNLKRNSLIIQNQSSATVAGDVAPTLYVGFNVQAIVGQSLALVPGLGFYWGAADTPPRDSIFLAYGPYSNAGGSVVVAGCVIQGTYTPNAPPYSASANVGYGGAASLVKAVQYAETGRQY